MSLSPFSILVLSFRSLLANPLRSAMTTLGVFMGVAAVNATLQVGNISHKVIAKQLAEREAPQLIVNLSSKDGKTLQVGDMTIVKQQIPELQAISASVFVDVSEVIFQDQQAQIEIQGVSADYLQTSGQSLEMGRFFIPADFANYWPVVVIDRSLADQLFQGQDPIGQSLAVGGDSYTVVGVIETKLRFAEKQPQGQLLIPLSFATALSGSSQIDRLYLRPANLEAMAAIEKKAEQVFQQRYPGRDFQLRSNVTNILAQRQTLNSISLALLAVAVIALLVGGVGLANITVAEVMERTREIGLRRAIGATRRDIMAQFILEAVLLSLLGGVAAIIIVHGATSVVAKTFNLPYEFNSRTAVLSLSTALMVGGSASFFPALRASRLDPVQALHTE